MADTPDLNEQILQSHAGLIHRVVLHCNNPGSIPDLEEVLRQAQENDWTQLVAAIRGIMAGRRDETVMLGLDDEDRVIVEAILNPKSPAANKAIKELKLPAESILATIIRENQIIFPKGNIKLLPGDSIIALSTIEQESALKEALVGKE